MEQVHESCQYDAVQWTPHRTQSSFPSIAEDPFADFQITDPVAGHAEPLSPEIDGSKDPRTDISDNECEDQSLLLRWFHINTIMKGESAQACLVYFNG